MTRLESDEAEKRNFYFSFFFEDISPLGESLVSLLWISGDVYPGFQSQSGSCASSPACNGFLRFTSGASPTKLLLLLFMASIAAEPFWSNYFFEHWYTDTQDWVSGIVYALTIWTTEKEKETSGDKRFCASDSIYCLSPKAHADTYHLQFRLPLKQHDNNATVLHKWITIASGDLILFCVQKT